MRDLRSDLAPLWERLEALPRHPGSGRAIMLVGLGNEEIVTQISASLACLASAEAKRHAWLVDLNFSENPAFQAFEQGHIKGIGRPACAYDATLQTTPPYTLTGARLKKGNRATLAAYEIEGQPLLVTRLRTEALAPNQQISPAKSPDWWARLRKMSDWAIAKAPPLRHSNAGLLHAADMDGVILSIEAERVSASAALEAKHRLEKAGAKLLGTILTDIRKDARWFARFQT